MTVRGTAGGTPASAAKIPASRRESSIFATPSVVGTRPPSVLSDTDSVVKDRRLSQTPTLTKPALGRSIRANGPASSLSASTSKRTVDGAMGPPPTVSRSQSANAATPTRIPSGSFVRGTPSTIKATPVQRRSSASILEPSKLRTSTSSLEKLQRLPSLPSANEPSEKENSAPSPSSSTSSTVSASKVKVTRRLSAMPA